MELTGTILDTLRAALRSSRQPIQNECLAEGLETFMLKQAVRRQAEDRHREKLEQEAKQAENRTNADSGTLPPELEDLSRIFED